MKYQKPEVVELSTAARAICRTEKGEALFDSGDESLATANAYEADE